MKKLLSVAMVLAICMLVGCGETAENQYTKEMMNQALFTVMLLDVHEKVYCSCWRLPCRDRVNLQTIMDMFGFKEILKPRVSWKIPHNCFRNYVGGCVKCSGDNCECYEDLYLREK